MVGHAALVAALVGSCAYTMPQDMHMKPGGLFTDPSPHSSAPAGALRVADNVVIRRDGIAEPRPGFEATTLTSPPNQGLLQMIAYDGDVLIFSKDSGATVRHWLSDTSTVVSIIGSQSYGPDQQRIFGAEARSNLYFTNGQYGIARISGGGRDATDDTATGSAMCLAGNPASLGLTVSDSGIAGSVLVTGSSIAYRAIVKTSRIGNPLDVASFPSGRAVFKNVSGATRNPVITVVFPTHVLAGDVIEFYRSAVTTGDTPDDNMQLVKSYTLLAADITAGYYSFTDSVATEGLGAFLYSNPNQEGLEGSNQVIAGAHDVALFRGSLFAADLTGPWQQIVTYDMGGTALTTDTGIGRRTIATCRRTNGSAVITLASTTGLRVGQILSVRTNWSGSGVVRITSIVANTSVTMNTTWTGATDGVDVSLTFKDTINIDGNYYDATSPATMVQGSVIQYATTDGVADDINMFAVAIGDGQRYRSDGADWTINNATVLWSEIFPEASGTSAPAIWATHGDEYKPALAATSGTATNMERDRIKNGLAWSKLDQPEHFPLTNRIRIGGETKPILRIIPTRDALWIFKTDGIWRLTGNGSPDWRVDPVDLTTYLITPKAAVVMDDAIYAWTNHGVVRVSDSGIARVGALAIGTDLRKSEISLGIGNVLTPGVFAVANPKDNEVIFGTSETSADTAADTLYVFNTKTEAWTKWLKDTYSCGVFDPSDSKLKFGKGASYAVDKERLAFSRTDTADYSYTLTLTGGSSGTTIEWSAPTSPSGYVPAVGDTIRRARDGVDTYYRITAVASNTSVTVDTDIPDSNGVWTAFVGYESCIEPVARTGGNASLQKHWQQGSWVFGRLDYVERVTLKHSSDLSDTLATETRTFTAADQPPRPVLFRVPRAHARASMYWPRLCIRQACSDWSVEQVSLFYEVSSPRVRR